MLRIHRNHGLIQRRSVHGSLDQLTTGNQRFLVRQGHLGACLQGSQGGFQTDRAGNAVEHHVRPGTRCGGGGVLAPLDLGAVARCQLSQQRAQGGGVRFGAAGGNQVRTQAGGLLCQQGQGAGAC